MRDNARHGETSPQATFLSWRKMTVYYARHARHPPDFARGPRARHCETFADHRCNSPVSSIALSPCNYCRNSRPQDCPPSRWHVALHEDLSRCSLQGCLRRISRAPPKMQAAALKGRNGCLSWFKNQWVGHTVRGFLKSVKAGNAHFPFRFSWMKPNMETKSNFSQDFIVLQELYQKKCTVQSFKPSLESYLLLM